MSLEKQVVVFRGWEPGFNKVGFTALMQAEVGVSLSAAKDLTDKLLTGEPVIVWVHDLPKTVDQARNLGAVVVDEPWGKDAN
jgi:hypothetical protein